MRRRLTAVVAGWALVALWATPAYAFTTPEFLQAPAEGEVVNGSATIRVYSEAATLPLLGLGLEKVSIEVTVVPHPGTGGSNQSLGKREGETYEATWNTGSAPYNGKYDLVAVATSNSNSPGKQSFVRNLMINNPPAAPTGVKAALSNKVPRITWEDNSEKDLIGYRVLRSLDGSAYTQVYAGDKTSITDPSAPHSAALTYKVAAVRNSPLTSAGLETFSGATSPITIPAPPPDPTTGAQPGSDGEPVDPTVPGTNIVTGDEPEPSAPLLTNNTFRDAIAPVVTAPQNSGTGFDPDLPYEGVPPERFESAGNDNPSAIDAAATSDSGGNSVNNPALFIGAGIGLLLLAGLMWRASRKLLRGLRDPEDGSPLINYPVFRISRS